MYSYQNNSENNSENNFQGDTPSLITSVSKSMLNGFQNSFQLKLQSLQDFQSQLQDKKEFTIEKFEAQKQDLQILIVEIASFLDDLMLPLVEKNPFYVEDFLIFMEDFIKKLETQFRLFTTLSVSSLRSEVRKQVAKTSQNFETKALKQAFEEKQKQTLAQTELLLETLNEQLIDIRHRIEKQKDKVLNNPSVLSLPSLSLLSNSSSELSTLSEKTVSNFELIKQDIQRFFM